MSYYQYYAGYILDSVNKLFRTSDKYAAWKLLLESLSLFDLQFNFEPAQNIEESDSVIHIANNLISRGIPTRPSVYLENQFSELLGLTIKKETKGSIVFDFRTQPDDEFRNLLLRSFCVIDPRISHPVAMEGVFGSNFEKDVLLKTLPSIAGGSFITQLIEPQRSLTSLINIELPTFQSQTVDFSIEIPLYFDPEKFPGVEARRRNLAIEVDGPHHSDFNQRVLDIIRDRAADCDTVRITQNDSVHIAVDKQHLIASFLDRHFIKYCKLNFTRPLISEAKGLQALQLTLAPIAIARIQKTLIQLILQKRLNLLAPKWRIAVFERDVPCAHLALEDFKSLIDRLFVLENKGRKLPEIELVVINTNEFTDSEINSGSTVYDISNLPGFTGCDTFIDISILQRPYATSIEGSIVSKFRPASTALIRSSFSSRTERAFDCAPPLIYDPLIKSEGNTLEEDIFRSEVLRCFIQDIFRKTDYREGQKEIISRALTFQSVIALLPTGGGKSLTYQMSALLQPGICLVVDPIKSLMQDQHDNLSDACIDATVFINSTLSTKERQQATDGLIKGHYLFAFISPERMQIAEFREAYLGVMHSKYRKHFNYCVIDEAHCLSEWGHDFRTSYLRLGKNAIKYCISGLQGRNIPILALTGTASYDVLADVQREVKIDDEIAIITPKQYRRPELKFRLIDAEKSDAPDPGQAKRIALKAAIEEIPTLFDHGNPDQELYYKPRKEFTNSGIIFCPHRTYTYGVEDILGFVNQTFPLFRDISGYYYGAEKNSEDQKLTEKQRLFKNNKLSLLVATKAFGMGIDKPNIRYTIHLNMPPSIESYYQEAGRAGRDQNDSYCYILYHKEVDKKINLSFFNNSFKGQERELGYVNELLTEITYPYSDNVRRIQELVVDELGVTVKINRWQQHGFDRLYINSDEVYSLGNQQRNKSFGYINVSDLSFVVETDANRAYGNHSVCKKVLDELVQIILTEKPNGATVQQWLDTLFQIPKKPGIEEALRKSGEEYSFIEIGFENDKINCLNDYLRNQYDPGFNEYIIRNAIGYCESAHEFARNLTNKYHSATGRWLDNDVRDEILADSFIHNIFPQIRLDQDTYKAVYRLSLLGVISDFTVDYRTRMVSATLHKCSDEEIISELKKYIALYEPQVIIDLIEQKIAMSASQSGNSVLREAVKYLIDFIYDRIADKRRRAIDEMERAILAGFGKSGNSAFEEAVYFYFDSKITPELRADLKNLKEVDLDLVWKYITKTAGKSDEIGHLRGACSRLLIEYPDNPILFLLMAFANFSTRDYDLKVAQNDFRRGWELFLTKYQMSFTDYEEGIKQFIELTVGYNKFTRKLLEPELVWVKIHFLETNPSRLDAVFDILDSTRIPDLNRLVIQKTPGGNRSINLLFGILRIYENDTLLAKRFLRQSIDEDFFLNELLFGKLLNYAKNREESFKSILAEILVEMGPSFMPSIHDAFEDNYTSGLLLQQITKTVKRINSKLYEQFGPIK